MSFLENCLDINLKKIYFGDIVVKFERGICLVL